MKNAGILVVICAMFLLGACAHHPVAFDRASYTVNAERSNEAVIAVIDRATLDQSVDIHSFMTGIANVWEAKPGQMLKQVADVELPQIFGEYRHDLSRGGNTSGAWILEMTVPTYSFANFRATVAVRVVAIRPQGKTAFEKTYSAAGITQGGKMFWGGAFGMKSAIRQSSLAAYQDVFKQLRADLARAFREDLAATR
jgi:hypothetical protein